MKKNIIYILSILASLMLLGSCNDWLSVKPRGETTDIYNSEDGFKASLTGVYIMLGQEKVYGRNANMYIPECFVRHWTIPATNASEEKQVNIRELSNHNYEHKQTEIIVADTWIGFYTAIVQLNDMLRELESSSIRFEYNNDRILKGEGLGLRGFLHFELLRMFGPIPTEVGSEPAIPYVTEVTKEIAKLQSLPYQEVIQKIEQDLLEAERTLDGIDPAIPSSIAEMNNTAQNVHIKDDWHRSRYSRFNYYAIQGALARFYQWTGNKAKAIEYAKKVVEATNKDGNQKFELITEQMLQREAASAEADLSFYNEHLFGIHNPKQRTYLTPYFDATDGNIFTQTTARIRTAYEAGSTGADIRNVAGRYWIEKTTTGAKYNTFRKFVGPLLISQPKNRMPIIRLSEMYLILIEESPISDAKQYFSSFRAARGMLPGLDNTEMQSEATVKARVEKEYRKEFFGEGQMFYYYKRHSTTTYTWPISYTFDKKAYIIPKPKGQINYE